MTPPSAAGSSARAKRSSPSPGAPRSIVATARANATTTAVPLGRSPCTACGPRLENGRRLGRLPPRDDLPERHALPVLLEPEAVAREQRLDVEREPVIEEGLEDEPGQRLVVRAEESVA